MTKEEALAKIEELKKYVEEKDREKSLAYKRKEPGDSFFYVTSFGRVGSDRDLRFSEDDSLFESGNYKQTREQAERHAKHIKCLHKLLNLADELNEGWMPDWNNINQIKWFIKVFKGKGCFIIDSTFVLRHSLVYFKSALAAREALDRLDEEDKEVLKGLV